MAITLLSANPNAALYDWTGIPEDVGAPLTVTGTSTMVQQATASPYSRVVFTGTGLTMSGGHLSGGTVTSLIGYKDAQPHAIDFVTTGLTAQASVMLGFASTNNGLGLMKYLYSGDDTISNESNDCPSIIAGYGGNDVLIGGTLSDTAVYSGARSEYTVTRNSTGTYSVADRTANRDGTDTLSSIERLQFSDTKVALDADAAQSGGEAALLLGAALGKDLALSASKQQLMGSLIQLFDSGFTLQQLSGAFMRLPVWDALTGHTSATNSDIASYLLTTVNGRAPDAATLSAAVSALNAETTTTQGSYLAGLASSAANQIQIDLVGLQQAGIACA